MIEQKDLGFEQAILIGIINKNQPEDRIHEYLDELAFLTHTAGGTVSQTLYPAYGNTSPQNLYRLWKNGGGKGVCENP